MQSEVTVLLSSYGVFYPGPGSGVMRTGSGVTFHSPEEFGGDDVGGKVNVSAGFRLQTHRVPALPGVGYERTH